VYANLAIKAQLAKIHFALEFKRIVPMCAQATAPVRSWTLAYVKMDGLVPHVKHQDALVYLLMLQAAFAMA